MPIRSSYLRFSCPTRCTVLTVTDRSAFDTVQTVDMNLIAMQILNVMKIVKLANILFNVHIVTIVPDVLKLSQMCDIM